MKADSKAVPRTAPVQPAGDELTGRLLQRFKTLLAEQQILPGSKLPSERDLAEKFGVCRGSLRQALKVLQSMGVIRQHSGQGTFLAESAIDVLSEPLGLLVQFDSISPYELLEARLLLEPELTARAAERAMSEDLRRMKASMRAMEHAADDLARIAQADVDFHRAIVQAAGNRVCLAMLSSIQTVLFTSIMRIARLAPVRHTLQFHSAIYDAMYRRDPNAARQCMMEHLNDARRLLVGSGADEAPSSPVARKRKRAAAGGKRRPVLS